ncbi:hypothetical protein [Tenacibaculum agarivorans]|uniref:hypothetical protein n=1 Tax=Tenacibaculum agarivorans TaxID=1908389 RepID=UPI00094B8D0F|nr:hypothetical protein [Tenacibaculum agarivorans]
MSDTITNLEPPYTKGKIESYKEEEKAEKLLDYITERVQTKDALREFFSNLNTSYFLAEDPYIDKDFLEDYSNYYARSYKDHGRFCHRIHFFSEGEDFILDTKKFQQLVTTGSKEEIEKLNKHYLGFITLRPSTLTKRIGKTCLKNYGNDRKRNRQYTAVREYKVNLYGIPLDVKSMAFQEQDEAVAVCASIALWSAFQITGKHNQHEIPSPSVVTKLALSESSYVKEYPSIGLTSEQIAVAVNKVGITPTIREIRNTRELKQYIYAYLKAKIPIVCGISLFDVRTDSKTGHKVIASSKSFHAITINGFSFEGGHPEMAVGRKGLKLKSSRMTKFFAHDDQLCPFARIVFDSSASVKIGNIPQDLMYTTWRTDNEKVEKYKYAKIETIIVPLNHKVRVSYQEVLTKIRSYSVILRTLANVMYDKIGVKMSKRFEWEIYLTKVNDFKKEIRNNTTIDNKKKLNILMHQNYPKYIWVARAYIKEDIKLELVFDATESKITYLKDYIIHDPIFEIMGIFNEVLETSKNNLRQWIKKQY